MYTLENFLSNYGDKFKVEQEEPKQHWFVDYSVGLYYFWQFLQCEELPDEMFVSYMGSQFVFRTKNERFQFALGMELTAGEEFS